MSQHREQSQVGHFTPRPHFIVLTIAQRAHYKAESETACRVNVLKLVSPGGGSSSTYPYIHITINTLQVELKNAWGATDLVIMKCVCSSAGITNTCHTTEESQAIVVTPPKVHLDSLEYITVSEWGGP